MHACRAQTHKQQNHKFYIDNEVFSWFLQLFSLFKVIIILIFSMNIVIMNLHVVKNHVVMLFHKILIDIFCRLNGFMVGR